MEMHIFQVKQAVQKNEHVFDRRHSKPILSWDFFPRFKK